jgi:hypothetical protein
MQHRLRVSRQHDAERGMARVEHVGRLRERDGRNALHVVEADVAEDDARPRDLGRHALAAPGARVSAHLEDIGEIGVELECHRRGHVALAVVGERQTLVQPLLPQEARALDVDDAFGRRRLVTERRQRTIGHVRAKEHVVRADSRAQQRREQAADRQPEEGEDPRVVREQAIGAAAHVAQHIGHQERVVVLQRKRSDRAADPAIDRGVTRIHVSLSAGRGCGRTGESPRQDGEPCAPACASTRAYTSR